MYKDILKRYWGYDDFRGIQRQIIESIANGHDTLGLMPTGGGKSITFQVPALSMQGVCLVVTPLISLMKDQVDNLRRRGIIAHAIYTGISHDDVVKILDNCIYGRVKFLYVSPERLSSEFFITKLQHIKVSFITIDEAHCISQWGYDFRPSYLEIAKLRTLLPDKPVLALTATATPDVVEDICQQLSFSDGSNRFRMSFMRKNLTYVVRNTEDKEAELIHILQRMPGTAIVYVGSRKRTKEIAKRLTENGITADFYHAGLDIETKERRQNEWQSDHTRVIVATNAFGMGIDKPDVRMVIHYDSPNAIEAYFQEAGRAGRDGKASYAVLLHQRSDTPNLRRRVSTTFPGKDYVRDVYERLAYFYEIGVGMGRGITRLFDLLEFSHIYKLSSNLVDSSLHILDRAGYIRYEYDSDNLTRVMFIVNHDDLYFLEGLTQLEDNLITALLRNYTGLFTDYAFINEGLLAARLSVSRDDIIKTLKSLYHKRILKYIPPCQEPRITFLVDRVDGCDVILKPSVYDLLEQRMKEQIEAMICYAENDHTCRSRQLLQYFGEETTADDDCKHCDVCLSVRKAETYSGNVTVNTDDDSESPTKQVPLADLIKQHLNDKEWHQPNELRHLPCSRERLSQVLSVMMAEGIIEASMGRIRLC